MARYDAYNSECLVFSFKDGLLSRISHDLTFCVDRFSIEFDERSGEIRGTFDPSSLRLKGVGIDGRDDSSVLSEGDKKKLHDSIAHEVLHTRKHPEVRFASTAVTERGDGYVVEGQLCLHGRRRPIQAQIRPEGDRWVTAITLHQPDFGIKPFTAALGALRVNPDVHVRLTVPREVIAVR